MWLLETGTANFERLTGFNHEEERGMSPCFHLCHTKNPQGFFLNLSIHPKSVSSESVFSKSVFLKVYFPQVFLPEIIQV